MNSDDIKKTISSGGFIRGSHILCGDLMMTEAIAMCGFDVLWICMEHSALDKRDVLNNLIAARAGGSAAFVRIPWTDPVLAKPILDMGPDGIVFPCIRTVEDAKLAIAACTYPPEGVRGYCPQRAADYGAISQEEYVTKHYRKIMRIVQIEHIDAVNNLEEIAQLDGIDGFIAGPNDLSSSVGMTGHPHAPEMWPIYDRMGEILSKTGKLFGVAMDYNEPVLKQWIDRGCNCLFCGTELGYIHSGAMNVFNGMNDLYNKKRVK